MNTANGNWPLKQLVKGECVHFEEPFSNNTELSPELFKKHCEKILDQKIERLKKEGYTDNEAEIISWIEFRKENTKEEENA